MNGERLDSRILSRSVPRYHQLRYAAQLVASYVRQGVLIDIGCGPGLLASFLGNFRFIGLDNAYRTVRAATSKAMGASFLVGDILQLPMKDEVVDGVALIAVLGAVKERDEKLALAEVQRILKKGGHAIVLVSRRSPYSTITSERVLTRWQWRHFEVEQLLHVASQSGLECVLVSYRGGPLSVAADLLNTGLGLLVKRTAKDFFRKGISAFALRLSNSAEGLEFCRMPRWAARYAYLVLRKPT